MIVKNDNSNFIFTVYQEPADIAENKIYYNPERIVKIFKDPCLVWGLSGPIRKLISENSQLMGKICAIIDKKPCEKSYCGIPVFNPNEPVYKPRTILIGSAIHHQEIHELAMKKFGQGIAFYHFKEVIYKINRDIRPFLLVSTPRSGTHWLVNLTADTGFIPWGRRQSEITSNQTQIDFVKRFPLLKNGYFYYEHIGYKPVKDFVKLFFPKVILLYRDPRDTLVSNYFYVAHKQKLNKNYPSFRHFFFDQIKRHRFELEEIAMEWLQYPHLHIVKYENLVSDTEKELNKTIQFLNLNVEVDLQRIISKNNFQQLSGGRKPGEEDASHHYRKGVVGDWKNWFDEETEQAYFSEMSHIHCQMGYTLENNV